MTAAPLEELYVLRYLHNVDMLNSAEQLSEDKGMTPPSEGKPVEPILGVQQDVRKKRKPKGCFNIIFHNVNSFNDTIKQFYMSELICEGGDGPDGPLSLAMLQETRRDKVQSFGKWCVHTCPPGPNIGEGESAGVCAMARIHLAHTHCTAHATFSSPCGRG